MIKNNQATFEQFRNSYLRLTLVLLGIYTDARDHGNFELGKIALKWIEKLWLVKLEMMLEIHVSYELKC